MAILQVSRITNRKGLTENLPQLAGAELGWCIDSRRLFIGNGTLEAGAPVIGNTEILTEFSDVAAISSYIYKDIAVGYEPQTGPTPSDPVIRTTQERLDDLAIVRGFGAVGDGVTDDTAAINRALYQLYCVQSNVAVRRALYFPAGVYLVTGELIIPSFAKLVGEGADCTIIQMAPGSTANYVARYGDSLQQTGANIGNNGAIPPRNIEISGMTFKHSERKNVFLVESAKQCFFDSCNFSGSLTEQNIINEGVTNDIAGVRFDSSNALVCQQITFDKCAFTNITYGINTLEEIKGVTVSNSRFETLYQGISLGNGTVINGGPTGFRAVHNMFNRVFSTGILFGDVDLNISSYNVFYDVANGYSSTPTGPVVLFVSDNNVSVSDMFARNDSDALIEPRVQITGSSTQTGTQLQIGRYTRQNGRTFGLLNNQSNQTVFTLNPTDTRAFKIDYTIVRDTALRHGTITVANQVTGGSASTLSYTDDYTENADTGITLVVLQNTPTTVLLQYSSNNTGLSGTLTYSISHLA